jgi:predicted ATPase
MNIKSVRLRNFRGFRDATIQLKPLTVLLGPNSAGKSAFGHALAATAHAHHVYASTPQASLTPTLREVADWPVDLGQTEDLRTAGSKERITVTFETRGGPVMLGFGDVDKTTELLLSYIQYPTGEISAAAPLPIHTEIRSTVTSESVASDAIVGTTDGSIKLTRLNEQQWRDPESPDGPATLYLSGLLLSTVRHEAGTTRNVSSAAREDMKALLESLTYLRANRKRPSRGYEDGTARPQDIGYSGEFTPSILQRYGSNSVKYKRAPGIPATIEEARSNSYPWIEVEDTLAGAVEAWLRHLSLAENVVAAPPPGVESRIRLRVTLKEQQQRDITEIGFGVSQLVPVLVAGLRQSTESICIVDLPEAHLHLRPQGALADFFCSLALSGKTTLVETHSDMFFQQLRLRAAMDPVLASQIAVYFLDAPIGGTCCDPYPVGLDLKEEIRWPVGFLQEAWETESQIGVVREAQRLGRT